VRVCACVREEEREREKERADKKPDFCFLNWADMKGDGNRFSFSEQEKPHAEEGRSKMQKKNLDERGKAKN